MKFNLILGQGTSSFNFGYILQPIIKQISQSYKNREVLLSWLYRQRHGKRGVVVVKVLLQTEVYDRTEN